MNVKQKIATVGQSWGLLVAAVVLGAVAFMASSYYLESRERALADELLGQQEQRRDVVVATVELAPGAVISGENMAVASVPVGHLSMSAVDPGQFDSFANRVLLAPMSPGEPLLAHFASGINAERFSDLLEEGERAITLPVDSIKSNDGMLTFGDRIDLLLVLDGGSGSESARQQLVPLVENVRVLATGQTPLATRDADLPAGEGDPENLYSTVTVGVSSEQATQLLLAKDMGSVVVLLRNRSDEGPLQASTLSADGLLGGGRSDGYEYFSGSQSQGGTLQPTNRIVAGRTERRVQVTAAPAPEVAPAIEPETAAPEPSTEN